MSDDPVRSKALSPRCSADQILASVRAEGRAVRNAATATEGLALTRAFQAITAPHVRAYVIELIQTLAARESSQT